MQKIKIKFVDFWYGFAVSENYFFKLLSSYYEVELSQEPDFIIYSCYGNKYLKYKCTRIFYSAERVSPDYGVCDFAITFDYSNNPRHFRFPLYGIYIDQAGTIEQLQQKKTREQALNIWRSKTKFCCLVVSNGNAQKRLDFFKTLSQYKHVDSGGTVLNNIGGPVKDKMKFIKDYRFVIAFENTSYPGYTTEKIVEPFLNNSIPLYWGNVLVNRDFNSSAFLNLHDFETEQAFIKRIKEIDHNDELAIEMLLQPVFNKNVVPEEIDKQKVLAFFKTVVESLSTNYIPVAKTWKGYSNMLKVYRDRYIYLGGYYINRLKERIGSVK